MSDGLAFQVELFAEPMVRLDDPFGSREAVLVGAALDRPQRGHPARLAAVRTRACPRSGAAARASAARAPARVASDSATCSATASILFAAIPCCRV
jgi:hypothetical protein